MSEQAKRPAWADPSDARDSACRAYTPSVSFRPSSHARHAHGERSRGGRLSRGRIDSRGSQAAGAARAPRVRVRRRPLSWGVLALTIVSDKVPRSGGVMTTKRSTTKTRAARKTTKKRSSKRPSKAPPKRSAKSRKAGASKRPSKSPPKAAKAATNGAPTNGAGRKAKPTRKRPSKAPRKSGTKRTTRSSKIGAIPSSGAVAPRPAPTPDVVPGTAHRPGSPGSRPRHPESYLDDMPRDHAEVLAGFLRVVKTAAGDLRKLILQAIALSNQRRDRFDR